MHRTTMLAQVGCMLLLALLCPVSADQIGESVWSDEIDSFSGGQDIVREDPTVCFVVRTYWGHGDDYGDRSIRTLLAALQAQRYTRWEALMVVLDNRPFPEIRRILRDYQDDRIWVYAEWVNYKYEPKKKNSNGVMAWSPGYHNKLYNLTDEAIRACPPTTEWVIVTNGDNNYDPSFLDEVLAAPPSAQAVAVDYYSRYQRPTAHQCERFAEGADVPHCKENLMRFCQTDLAASAYRWAQLLAEGWRFGLQDLDGDSGANDGIMSQNLLISGWQVHRVHRCLVDHGPSPQQCAMEGGVWDDSRMSMEGSFGGECLRTEAAKRRIAESPATLQVLKLSVAYDVESFGFEELQGDALPLACIQSTDPATWTQAQVFGKTCCARSDVASFPTDLAVHPWDEWADEELWGASAQE